MRRETTQRLDSSITPQQPQSIELSTGQRLVGVGKFVHSDERVEFVKEKFAEIADILLEMQENNELTNRYHQMMHDEAVMDIVKASMISVKVLTFKFLD
jgi:hypothetical protein